ncbi:MAG: DUF169 domain-containing protein [Methanolinea sp.]|nr:DUF169 domain-containing protein [Methanolinea sp.]
MDTELRDRFIALWDRYFPSCELPITFELSGRDCGLPEAKPPGKWRCVVCDLARVRRGKPLLLGAGSLSCSGAQYYLGYVKERSPDFRYFLSTGKPGSVRGERYRKSPELVDALASRDTFLPAGERKYLFRRWDTLSAEDSPDVVVFFARGEVLSGLFTLANFESPDPHGVTCPFGSGCSSIIHYPLLEGREERPRAVLGMFDPSARPCVPLDMLTMAFPMGLFYRIVDAMEESFLATGSWEKVREKILGASPGRKTD